MEEGDLCSVRSGGGDYVVAKILKLEEGVVHPAECGAEPKTGTAKALERS